MKERQKSWHPEELMRRNKFQARGDGNNEQFLEETKQPSSTEHSKSEVKFNGEDMLEDFESPDKPMGEELMASRLTVVCNPANHNLGSCDVAIYKTMLNTTSSVVTASVVVGENVQKANGANNNTGIGLSQYILSVQSIWLWNVIRCS